MTSFESDFEQELQPYRAISKAAIASVAFAVLGLFAFSAPIFVILPVLAICFGLTGLSTVRRLPDEFVGKSIAMTGLIAGLLVAVSSSSLHMYVYATEVPADHERISFYELKPKSRAATGFSDRAAELDGKQVFLKGYVRPGNDKSNLSTFVLTGDFGDCCFGGNPKINEIVGVRIMTDQTVDYGLRLRKVIGTFRLNRQPKYVGQKDVPSVLYEIEATKVL